MRKGNSRKQSSVHGTFVLIGLGVCLCFMVYSIYSRPISCVIPLSPNSVSKPVRAQHQHRIHHRGPSVVHPEPLSLEQKKSLSRRDKPWQDYRPIELEAPSERSIETDVCMAAREASANVTFVLITNIAKGLEFFDWVGPIAGQPRSLAEVHLALGTWGRCVANLVVLIGKPKRQVINRAPSIDRELIDDIAGASIKAEMRDLCGGCNLATYNINSYPWDVNAAVKTIAKATMISGHKHQDWFLFVSVRTFVAPQNVRAMFEAVDLETTQGRFYGVFRNAASSGSKVGSYPYIPLESGILIHRRILPHTFMCHDAITRQMSTNAAFASNKFAECLYQEGRIKPIQLDTMTADEKMGPSIVSMGPLQPLDIIKLAVQTQLTYVAESDLLHYKQCQPAARAAQIAQYAHPPDHEPLSRTLFRATACQLDLAFLVMTREDPTNEGEATKDVVHNVMTTWGQNQDADFYFMVANQGYLAAVASNGDAPCCEVQIGRKSRNIYLATPSLSSGWDAAMSKISDHHQTKHVCDAKCNVCKACCNARLTSPGACKECVDVHCQADDFARSGQQVIHCFPCRDV